MPLFTAQNIIDRAAAAADMHDSFVQPATWLAWINNERLALETFCVRHGWVLSRIDSFDIAATGSANLTFPTTYDTALAIIGIWEVDTSGRMRQLAYTDYIDNLKQDSSTGPVTGPAQSWSASANFDSNSLLFTLYPRPTSGTYRVVYLQTPSVVSATTDSFTYPLGMEELIVLKCARRALVKEESDVSGISALIDDEQRRIEEICWSKVLGDAPAARNVDVQRHAWTTQMILPGPQNWFWM